VLSIPLGFFGGLGAASRKGILIKGGNYLEALNGIDTFVFDKTGTLTVGRPVVTDVLTGNKGGELDILSLAASLEQGSEHHLGKAIVQKAEEFGSKLFEPKDFKAIAGKGISGRIDDRNVLIGNRALMEESGFNTKTVEDRLQRLEGEGKTAVIIASGNEVVGVIGIADALKSETPAVVATLKGQGVDVIMLTGDNEKTARSIADEAGIDRVIAEVLPGEKADTIRDLQEKGEVVAFIGDGINDAPALAQADIGIALGSGTDVAVESGEIVLVRDDLMDVVRAIALSKGTMGKIRQNLVWAFGYNSVLIPVAAGILNPFYDSIVFKPEWAGLAMALSSVSVLTNSLLLKRIKLT